MNVNKDNILSCPVCDKQFEKEVIEQHVNKCLFLNTLSENKVKRDNSHLEENSISKKSKIVTSPVSGSSTSKVFEPNLYTTYFCYLT